MPRSRRRPKSWPRKSLGKSNGLTMRPLKAVAFALTAIVLFPLVCIIGWAGWIKHDASNG